MKRMILTRIFSIIALCLIYNFSMAAGSIKVADFSNHIPLSKNKIYDRTMEWLLVKWVSSQNVVLYKDRDSGRIVVQGKLINKPGQVLTYIGKINIIEKQLSFTFELTEKNHRFTNVDLRRAKMKLGTVYHSLKTFQRKKSRNPRSVRRSQSSVVIYHGNIKTGVYHAPYCRYYDDKECSALIKSKKAARHQGFRPCRVCNP